MNSETVAELTTTSHVAEVQDNAQKQVFAAQKHAFALNSYPSRQYRQEKLLALSQAIKQQREAITTALTQDFTRRSTVETDVLEIVPSLQMLRYYRRHLRAWMRPQTRAVNPLFLVGQAKLMPQPLGVIGIVVPWNYPFYLAISGLLTAIASGNRVMLKLSELTPSTNSVLKKLVQSVFSTDEVAIITGDDKVGQRFVRLPFDHLLFTGSQAVGQQVLSAASQQLTPTTLELGGKSPAIISANYPMSKAVASIMMGKLVNAGQTCIAPDYVLVPEAKVNDFIQQAKQWVLQHYPQLPNNPDYTAIISPDHFQRLVSLIHDARDKGADIIELAKSDKEALVMPPRLLLKCHNSMRILQEEIFGPLLPVIPYKNLDEVIDYINQRPHPLALYYFDHSKINIRRLLRASLSGGVTINDTLLHAAQLSLPFGGVGASGIGSYHSQEGFNRFSHLKPVFYQSSHNFMHWLYPPYGKLIRCLLTLLMR